MKDSINIFVASGQDSHHVCSMQKLIVLMFPYIMLDFSNTNESSSSQRLKKFLEFVRFIRLSVENAIIAQTAVIVTKRKFRSSSGAFRS